jgi:putative ABC transport system permease protein
MVMNALFVKALRDMRRSKAQFISILIMATIAVSIVTGIDSIWKTIDTHASAMYDATNIADLWVNVAGPTEKELWSIAKIEGVEKVEKRFTLNALSNLKGSPTLRVYAVSGKNTLDRPKLLEGTFPSSGGAILDEVFARVHGLKINDELTVKINGKWTHFPIEGLALSSEHVYSVKGATDTFPNPKKYGFVVINDDTLKGIYGQKPYNQISVKLASGADITEVQAQIDKILGEGLMGILAKEDHSSISNTDANIQQFRLLAKVFSLMFFLVTALITQSTMVRMIESQRTQIGILKALGYKRSRILWHYTSYGVYMGLLGAFLGLIIGPNLFGRILIPWLKLNFMDYGICINYVNFFIGLALILLCTGGVSLYTCLKLQGDSPSMLLRNKEPKIGSHIFLEYLPKLWNHMRFSRKLIARNILRNKMRLMMSVLGIAGCTALIVAAFTITNMINGIVMQTYKVTYTYDQKIILNSKANGRFIHNLMLDGTVQPLKETAVQILCPHGQRKMKLLTVSPQDSPLIHLTDPKGTPVRLPQDGISITRKLAQTLDVGIGDMLEVKRANESYVKVPVKQILYMAAGQGMYMTDTYYESLGETFEPTAILVKWNQAPDQSFLDGDYVDEYVNRSSQIADIQATTRIVYIAAIMLIVMGGILAFVVLYNSSILNFAERIRDLATLQVLGFYQNEIRSLVLTENMLSVLLGFILGIPLGKILADIVAGGLNDQMDLLSHVSLGTAGLSMIITFIFALIINSIIAKNMQSMDMLEALKSVE